MFLLFFSAMISFSHRPRSSCHLSSQTWCFCAMNICSKCPYFRRTCFSFYFKDKDRILPCAITFRKMRGVPQLFHLFCCRLPKLHHIHPGPWLGVPWCQKHARDSRKPWRRVPGCEHPPMPPHPPPGSWSPVICYPPSYLPCLAFWKWWPLLGLSQFAWACQ